MKLKYFKDKDPWMLAEDIPDIDLFFSFVWLDCFVNTFERQTGRAYKKILSVHRGYHQWFYFGLRDSKEVGDNIVRKLLRTPEFATRINRECIAWADRMYGFARKIPPNLGTHTDRQLLKIYLDYHKVHQNGYEWGWIPVAADMFHNNLTDALKNYLNGLGIKEERINQDLVVLTQPTQKSEIQVEQEELLKIAVLIGKKPIWRKIFKLPVKKIIHSLPSQLAKPIDRHYEKYFWSKFLFLGTQGVYDKAYYIAELKRLLSEGSPTKQLKAIDLKFQKEKQDRQKLIKKLKIKDPWLTILNQWGGFMITKIYRRYAQIYLLYRMDFVLKELSRRFGLTVMQMRLLLPKEVEDFVVKGKEPAELQGRTKLLAYYAEKNADKMFFGKAAEVLEKNSQRLVASGITELSGQTGCAGYGRGRVKIIIRAGDMKKMKKGDVLVSIATDPDIVPAMKMASAIVTEQGGVTSHAAIVSRELGVPCVIGTKIATKVFKDGDMVEVDANKGIVRKI